MDVTQQEDIHSVRSRELSPAILGRSVGSLLRMFSFLAMVAVLLHVAGVSARAEQKADAPLQEEYLVGIGDVLDVSVWGEPDLSQTVFVRIDGKISLPLVGDIEAYNVSPAALAKEIGKNVAKFVADPSVTVTLKDSRSKRYYVLGQIAKPGEYPMDYPLTILQAIARAGGLLEWAKKSKIMLVRRDGATEKIIPFDYENLLSGDNLAQNILVVPGDTVVIP